MSERVAAVRARLAEFQTTIKTPLAHFFECEEARLKKLGFSEADLKALAIWGDITNRQAKRLRAFFASKAYQLRGGADQVLCHNLGAIIEMTHGYILILDDFQDQSRLRRGGMSAHQLYKDDALQSGQSVAAAEHYGNALAANIAFVGAHVCHRLLGELSLSLKDFKDMHHLYSEYLEITGHGQANDISNGFVYPETEEAVVNTFTWKTGNYTYDLPLQLGARLAGEVTPEESEILKAYAQAGGIAFQIKDDIIGVFGDSKETGKSNLDDLAEGKYTLLVHYALERGTELECSTLRAILGRPDLELRDHARACEIFVNTKALERAEAKARLLTNQALSALEAAPASWNQEAKEDLAGLAEYVINRTS